ncbi:protease [Lactococcus lactis]|nr:protease [Lactococcus lactis]
MDNVGLHFVLDMPDTTVGHDVYNNIKAGNLKGMSFGFVVADGGDSWRQGASKPIRTINQLQTLGEISVVSKPAYDDTSINVTRSIKQFEDERTRKYKEKVRAYLDGLSD